MTQFDKRNLTMMMDFYEMTMANGYFASDDKDAKVAFDVFYRKNPDEGGFAIFAGLEQVIEYVENMCFSEEDVEYFRAQHMFSEEFLDYLRNFHFTGDIYSLPEGTVMYPNEPILTVVAPLIDAQLVETAILAQINHQSLIATKSRRICKAAAGRAVSDFGARRAHNMDAATYGARAAYIGGVVGTATVSAGQMFDIPISGTMAHSWVMFYGDEYEAFKKYAQTYPDATVLLVDTYDVIHSGIPNAIRIAHEVLEPMGKRLVGIRIDSGDLAYLSKRVRKMLDAAGLPDCKIVVSNSLDEFTVSSLLQQGACIDSFGIGAEPDAAEFGDGDVNTLRTIAASPAYATPHLAQLGLFNIDGVGCGAPVSAPLGAFARLRELSRGKDTTTGHWEIGGVISEQPMPTFPDGFPPECIEMLEKAFGKKPEGTHVWLDGVMSRKKQVVPPLQKVMK